MNIDYIQWGCTFFLCGQRKQCTLLKLIHKGSQTFRETVCFVLLLLVFTGMHRRQKIRSGLRKTHKIDHQLYKHFSHWNFLFLRWHCATCLRRLPIVPRWLWGKWDSDGSLPLGISIVTLSAALRGASFLFLVIIKFKDTHLQIFAYVINKEFAADFDYCLWHCFISIWPFQYLSLRK